MGVLSVLLVQSSHNLLCLLFVMQCLSRDDQREPRELSHGMLLLIAHKKFNWDTIILYFSLGLKGINIFFCARVYHFFLFRYKAE